MLAAAEPTARYGLLLPFTGGRRKSDRHPGDDPLREHESAVVGGEARRCVRVREGKDR